MVTMYKRTKRCCFLKAFPWCNRILIVAVPPRCLVETAATFTVPLKDVTVPEEESVTLECELSKPDQKVKWFKNGKEMKPDRKRGISPKVEGTKHTLTIPKTLKDDTAEYSVKIGEEETKGKLTVEGMNV